MTASMPTSSPLVLRQGDPKPARRAWPRVILVALMLSAGCGDEGNLVDTTPDTDPQPVVTTVEVSPPFALLGDTDEAFSFEAVAYDQDGNAMTGVSFAWSSSDTEVAHIGTMGEVSGVSPGRTEVRATASGVKGVADLAIVTARAYVSHRSAVGSTNPVMMIDVAEGAVVDTALVGILAGEIAFGPGEENLYVTTNPSQPGELTVVQMATNGAFTSVEVGVTPIYAAASPDGSHVYVGNVGDGTVSVVETVSRTLAATVDVAGLPRGIAVTPDGSETWIALGDDCPGRIDVVDTATHEVIDSIFPGTCTGGDVAFTPDGGTAYVPDGRFTEVVVLDVESRTVTTTVPGFFAPRDVAVTRDGAFALVTNYASNGSVVILETSGNTLVERLDMTDGRSPANLALSPEGVFAYVTIPTNGEVGVIDIAGREIVDYIAVGDDPFDVAFTR